MSPRKALSLPWSVLFGAKGRSGKLIGDRVGLRLLVLVPGATALLWANSAFGSPEWHVGVQPALALDFPDDARFAFHGSLEADILFGRDRSGAFAFGPSVEVATWAFSDVRTSALGLAVIPIGDLDLGLSVGPQWQYDGESELAVAARAFLGVRAYNHSAAYGTGFGLVASVDQGVSHFEHRAFMLGLHIDGMWTALPFMAAVSWFRGSDAD